ncbi:unnamed protein product [Rotaria sp. Silwood1]|nr:unnamed protein product [Rotaria sp. Silwood1]CAF1168258.1 unnamed protein product [Rotaria sp. Silwood1]CAF3433471.1 unnamed protein product [Rotaria sp. Silwood1]CAF3486926.1 unnamed protein product [Rotaria sp. Silwood1]CAF3495767.1 unnamed protein product [Rotaria sp. Silwood1]
MKKEHLLISFIYTLISGIWTSFIMIVVHNRVPNVLGHHLDCTPLKYGTSEEILSRCIQIFLFQGLLFQGVLSYGDCIFSSHTVILTLLNHCITECKKKKRQAIYICKSLNTTSNFYVIHLFSWFCKIFSMILIQYYTIDVFIIVIFLTSRLFLYYHSLTNNAILHSKSDNCLSIWFSIYDT